MPASAVASPSLGPSRGEIRAMQFRGASKASDEKLDKASGAPVTMCHNRRSARIFQLLVARFARSSKLGPIRGEIQQSHARTWGPSFSAFRTSKGRMCPLLAYPQEIDSGISHRKKVCLCFGSLFWSSQRFQTPESISRQEIFQELWDTRGLAVTRHADVERGNAPRLLCGVVADHEGVAVPAAARSRQQRVLFSGSQWVHGQLLEY